MTNVINLLKTDNFSEKSGLIESKCTKNIFLKKIKKIKGWPRNHYHPENSKVKEKKYYEKIKKETGKQAWKRYKSFLEEQKDIKRKYRRSQYKTMA